MSQDLDNALGLLCPGCWNDQVGEVLALVPAEEALEFQLQTVAEVRAKILDDVRFGRRCETRDRRTLPCEVLADEP